MADIFVSYAREDRAKAEPFVAMLEAQGWSVWWDKEIGPGSSFSKVIEKEIAQASCVIVLWTLHSVASEWVNAEATEGFALHKLIPVNLDDVDVPLIFRQTQAANLSGWPNKTHQLAIEQLFEAISALISRPVTRPLTPPNKMYRRHGPIIVVSILLVVLIGFVSFSYLSPVPAVQIPNQNNKHVKTYISVMVLPVANMQPDISVEIAESLARVTSIQVKSPAYAKGMESSEADFNLQVIQIDNRLSVSLFDNAKQRTYLNFEIDLTTTSVYAATQKIVRKVLKQFDRSVPIQRTSIDNDTYLAYLTVRSEMKRHLTPDKRLALTNQLTGIIKKAPRFSEAVAALCTIDLGFYQQSREPEGYALAEKHCLRAARIDKDNPMVNAALGNLYRLGGQMEDAKTSYQAALTNAPFLTTAISGLAKSAYSAGNFTKAISLMKEAQSYEPNNWVLYHTLARMYFKRGQFHEAASQYEQAIHFAQDKGLLLNDLGSVYFMLENFDKAIVNWNRSNQIETNYAALSNLGSAYYFNGQFDLAVQAYRKAIELNDTDYRMWLNAGEANYHSQNREDKFYKKSIELAQQLLTVNPDQPDVLSALALAYASINEIEKSHEFISQALLAAGNDIYVLYDIAAAYGKLGEQQNMIKVLEKMQQNGYSKTLIARDANFYKET